VGHWLQLLWANLLGLGPNLWRLLAGRNVLEMAVHLGWGSLRARSVDPRRILAALGRRGRRCRIHPTAVVEGCSLGDEVEIGAGAVVRGSVLGDGVVVEDQALVEMSVLASLARVQRKSLVKFSVIRSRASVAGVMQLGVVDMDASVKHGAVLMDMALGQGVQVRVGEQLRDAPLGLAGVCVGARTVVGSGVQVAPGRCLPPDLRVVPSGASLLRSIPDDIEGPVEVRDGRLVALGGGPGSTGRGRR
jgi:hypothetical protein